jgi:hypothetical protein
VFSGFSVSPAVAAGEGERSAGEILKRRTEVSVSRAAPGPESRLAFRSNCEIAIHVPDLARAEDFYASVLGFRLVAKSTDQLEFDTGALRL